MKWTDKRHHDLLEIGYWKHLHRVRVGWILDCIARERCLSVGAYSILDVGCGDAVVTKRLRSSFPDIHIWAIDLDGVRLRRATEYCRGVTYCQADVGALPFRSGIFDVVLCHHVVEHVDDDMRVLAECRRVLNPTGLFILGIPQEDGVIGRVVRMIHRRLYARGEHVNFYSISTMCDRLASVGFTSIEYRKFGFLFPFYYLHVLLVRNRLTFMLGHRVSQWFDATADSLIFTARKVIALGARARNG